MTFAHDDGAGFIVGYVGAVWLGGRDRLSFVERLSTNRLADLPSGQGRGTVLLNDTGRVVDLLAYYQGDDGALVITSAPDAAPAVAAQLRRYALYNDDVRVTDASAQVDVVRVVGSQAWAVAQDLVPELAEGGAAPAWREAGEGDDRVWLLGHVAPGGPGGLDLVVPANGPASRLTARLAEAGMAALDGTAYDAVRVRMGLPRFGTEIDGGANPLELGLRDLVDFGKGCYIGQEVVARLDAYDKLQRLLVRIEAAEPLAVGDAVSAEDGRRSGPRGGRVTTVAEAGGRWSALAIAPRGVAETGRGWVLAADGRRFPVAAEACGGGSGY